MPEVHALRGVNARALSTKSGIGLFGTAGLLLLIGAVIPVRMHAHAQAIALKICPRRIFYVILLIRYCR